MTRPFSGLVQVAEQDVVRLDAERLDDVSHSAHSRHKTRLARLSSLDAPQDRLAQPHRLPRPGPLGDPGRTVGRAARAPSRSPQGLRIRREGRRVRLPRRAPAFEGVRNRCGSPGSGHALHRHRGAATHPDTPVRGASRPSVAPQAERIPRLGPRTLFQAKRFATAPPQPSRRKLMVVVPGTIVTLRPASASPSSSKNGSRALERVRQRPVAQLDVSPSSTTSSAAWRARRSAAPDLGPARAGRRRSGCRGGGRT